jgi:hypothetical protein
VPQKSAIREESGPNAVVKLFRSLFADVVEINILFTCIWVFLDGEHKAKLSNNFFLGGVAFEGGNSNSGGAEEVFGLMTNPNVEEHSTDDAGDKGLNLGQTSGCGHSQGEGVTGVSPACGYVFSFGGGGAVGALVGGQTLVDSLAGSDDRSVGGAGGLIGWFGRGCGIFSD